MSTKFSPPARLLSLGPDFNRLWASSATSNLGDGVLRIALPLLAVRFTESPAAVAGLTIAANTVWIVFGLPAGALSDRIDRRKVIFWSAIVRSMLTAALVLLALLDLVGLPLIYVFAICIALAHVFSDSASPALVPQLVPRMKLQGANARRYGASLTMNEFFGPALGGVLFAAGRVFPFLLAGLAYGGAAALISLVKRGAPVARSKPLWNLLHETIEGVGFLAREPSVRILAVWACAANMAGTITFAVLVLHAVAPGPLGLSEASYGLVLASLGIGGLIGSILAGMAGPRIGERNLLALATFVMAADSAALAFSYNLYVIIPALILAAVGAAVFGITAISMIQQIAPDYMMSRVLAGYRITLLAGILVGAAIAGALGELAGDLRFGFALATAIFVVLTTFWFALPVDTQTRRA